MRINEPVLSVGQAAHIGQHSVQRTGTDSAVFSFNGPLTPTEVGRLNKAVSQTAIRVEKYWRTGDITVNHRGTRTPAKGTVVAGQPTSVAPVNQVTPQPIAAPPVITAPAPQVATPVVEYIDASDEDSELVEAVDETDAETSHRYIADPELEAAWAANEAAIAAGFLPDTFIFLGPSGSGKTDGAAYLAAKSGLTLTKVDGPSQTDPESWFGIREVIADPVTGASVTAYHESAFVRSLKSPNSVTFIDEFTRVMGKHRNIILPLADGTRRVTNPLTGEVIQVHPTARIILAGNMGLSFIDTYGVDIALLTRASLIEFDYLKPQDEANVLVEATGCTERVAKVLARFASDIRNRVKQEEKNGGSDLDPIATRQLILAARHIRFGLDPDIAVKQRILNVISDGGGTNSQRQKVMNVWVGLRPLLDNDLPVLDTDV